MATSTIKIIILTKLTFQFSTPVRKFLAVTGDCDTHIALGRFGADHYFDKNNISAVYRSLPLGIAAATVYFFNLNVCTEATAYSIDSSSLAASALRSNKTRASLLAVFRLQSWLTRHS